MKNEKVRSAALMVALVLLAGCGNSKPAPTAPMEKIESGLTLRYWAPGWVGSSAQWTESVELFGKLEEATGIHITMIHPMNLIAKNQLEELRAMDAVPDIIEWSLPSSYPGGPAQAIDDGFIAPLGELITRNAPNLLRILNRYPEIARSISAADGRYYAFPDLSTDPALRAQIGPLIRRSWLEKIGAKLPETIGEWYQILREFKNNSFGTPGSDPEYPLFLYTVAPVSSKDIELPDLAESNMFAGAYGVSHGFFRRNGTLRYGPVQPEYKQMLSLLSSWFKEGLIHPSISSPLSPTGFIQAIAKCGAWIGNVWSVDYLKSLHFTAASLPRLDGADSKPFLGPTIRQAYAGKRAAAVSASSRFKTQAVRWLDLAYGEWGNRLFNFGIEDESYRMERGSPVLTDSAKQAFAMGSNAGMSAWNAFYRFTRGLVGGPYDVSENLYRQVLEAQLPGSSAVILGWQRGAQTDPLSVLDADAGRRDAFRRIYGPIQQHLVRSFLAFVCGQRNMAEFDRFTAEVEQMGLPEAMAILDKADAAWRSKPNMVR